MAAPSGHRHHVVVTLAHAAIPAQYVDNGLPGPSAGDLRTYWIALTKPGRDTPIGTMTGSLLTTVVDQPAPGMELRTANLVFSVATAAHPERTRNQIVLGGVAAYPQQAPTIPTDTVTIRPVLGGTGKYAGATGWCRSIHYANGSWKHQFHLRLR